ncbi:DUF5666 domain-containing protein [Piscinibacter sp. XHJ-5]|uniref:DUF5666 domain-containing protein n=1 Tax=Piscinibacter sp. XHJ-5 TaxID=3037797 RepID=UPI0024533B91|nr:DUF5666 domain-containing protein [Piscinibacter sp. XHJ-5]
MSFTRLLLLCSAWLLALAAGCGGGGVDTGGTGAPAAAFSSGRISGFGSIVVNGVHFDESAAAIADDEGVAHAADALKLGMTVEVEAGPIRIVAGQATSTAQKVVFGSEIKGPVSSVGAGSFGVLGQTVRIDVNTVLDGLSGLADLHAGDAVEVFAFFDPATGTYAATRIERKSSLDAYKLVGPITGLDTAAETFAIGGANISYAGIPAAQLPGLANGALARVELQKAQQGGRWIATRIRTALPGLLDGIAVELEGYVGGFNSLADFKVKGVTVNASGSGVEFTKGSASQIENGARIEIEGRMKGGVLVAEKISVKKAKDGGRDDEEEFEVEGRIASVDTAAQSFQVRGVTVTFDAATVFVNGAASGLQAGARVDVKGVLSGGRQVRATRIEFK